MVRPRFFGLLLALITLLAFLPVARDGFVNYDDQDYVTENSVVQNGLTLAGIKWAFTTFHASNWHPLTWLSLMLDDQLFGLNAGAFHFVNALFHAANTVLLFLLLLRLTTPRSEIKNGISPRQNSLWPCAFVAALFAWHPLHIESVAWISERKDVLSAFFALLTLLSYARYAQSRSKIENQKSKAGSANSTRDYFLALIFFALSLMSKPMFVTLPFVMLLLDFWPLRRISNSGFQISNVLRLIAEKIPFFLLTAISCVVTYFAQSHPGENAVASLQLVPLHYRILNTLISYARYLLKLFWPAHLAVIYPLLENLRWMIEMAIVAAIILAAISWIFWRTRRRFPYLLVGWLWFLGTLVPVIGLVQVGGAALADRYTYFPAIGIFIAVAFGARDLAIRFQFPKFILPAAAILISGACLIVTEDQLRYWRDSETLFRHALAVTKNNDIAHLDLGAALELEGKKNEALVEYHAAEKIAPERYQIHV
ncbi:MAG: tetratricopeptide repeat protein, partial [Limisphaerales bacterium]